MFYTDRPKIRLQLTPLDKIVEIIGWSIVIATWCLVVLNYSKLPDTIPVHYNSSGQIDGYGDKSMIWSFLIIGSILYAGIFILSKVPHILNYPTKITEENAFSQYTTLALILRYLNLIIISIISYLTVKTVILAL